MRAKHERRTSSSSAAVPRRTTCLTPSTLEKCCSPLAAVLIAPQGHAALSARRILIAWKDTREARRAVQSALPFLQQAEHVTLVEVAENLLEAQAQAHLADVEAYLSRHGIEVGVKAPYSIPTGR